MPKFSATMKHRLKLVLFALTPAALLLICAEAYATFAIRRVARTAPDPETGQPQYVMRIGRFPWSRRSVTPLNKLGFPDVEFDQISTKGSCVHVVFAGDSFVFGDGVDQDSSFVGLIREWSKAKGPNGCVRVFNLGERGTTIDRQAQRIRETEAILQPDLVIVGQYQNDLTDLDTSTIPPDSAATLNVRRQRTLMPTAFNLNVVRLLSYHSFGIAIRRDIHWDLLARWSLLADTTRAEAARGLMSTYEAHYTELARELAAKQIPFGVVILPSKFDLLAGRFPEETFFLGLAERFDVPYLRTFPILDRHRSPYTFLMYDGHLNELGNRLVAQALDDWLFELEPAPFPNLRSR